MALASLFELATEVNRGGSARDAGQLKALAGTLGVLQQAPRTFLQSGVGIDEERIIRDIADRNEAKRRKDYAEADRIRKALLDEGIALKDLPDGGTTWVRA